MAALPPHLARVSATAEANTRLDGPPLRNPLSSSRRVWPSPLEIYPLIKLVMVIATEALMSAGMSGVSELTLGKGPSRIY